MSNHELLQENTNMANLSKIKRDKLLSYIEQLKSLHTDDESLILFNELQNALTEKRYGLVFEEHSEEVDELLLKNVPVLTADPQRRLCKDETLPWNFIIEGDNLQALYLLEKTHKGKVDCIYIDPPYNTGAKDWKYNNDYVGKEDDYRHSKWLSMMKSRLSIAKKLLNPDNSVLIVTIDEKEYLHLGCLLEEMFPSASIQMISCQINPAPVARKNQFGRTDEYLFYVFIGEAGPAALYLSDEWFRGVKNTTKYNLHWNSLLRTGTNNTRTHSPGCFYPIFVTEDGKQLVGAGDPLSPGEARESIIAPSGQKAIWPLHTDGSEGCWQCSPQNLMLLKEQGFVRLGGFTPRGMAISYLKRGEQNKVKEGIFPIIGYREDGSIIVDESGYKPKFVPGTQWTISAHDASRHGTNLIQKIFGDDRFDFPKSLYSVHDAIKFAVAYKPNALIVDFFAGSGTTQHAVNLLNAEDGGKRRCIMVTNNEVSFDETKELKKQGYNPGDEEWDRLGIARYVTWPRTVCSINGTDVNGVPLKGEYLAKKPDDTTIPMAEGFSCNVKYFKCEWIPRISEESLSEALMAHITEMIELEHAIEIDNKKVFVILSEEEADELEMTWHDHPDIKHIYISRNVLLTTNQNKLFNTVELHTIPDYYFDIEMKEVGETW